MLYYWEALLAFCFVSVSEQHPLLVTVDNFRQDTATCSGIINNADSGSGNNVIATAISNINNSNCNNSSQGNNNITTSASNIHVNSLTSDRNDNSSFVRTPPYTEQLSSTVIYIRNGNNHHENYTTQHIPPAKSCLVRFRQSCIKCKLCSRRFYNLSINFHFKCTQYHDACTCTMYIAFKCIWLNHWIPVIE